GLPAHDYSLIPVERYFALKGARQIDYISSQGCRFRCAFCADPAVFARGWTGLLPERVADEAAFLRRSYAMQEVAFQDETFFTSASRVDSIAEEFLRRDLRITWTATLRADQACRMGDDLFAKAVRSGLRRVMVGVESGSQEMLDRLKKDMKLEQVHTAAEMCTRHGIGAIFNFIVGFPGESEQSMQSTLALAKQLRRSNASFETPIFYYRPYPGNPMADLSAANGYVFPRGLEQWANFDYVGGRGPWMTPAQWRNVERFKFYTRHAWKAGAWRWPLRATSQWRCNRDWYGLPVEKMIVDLVRPPQQVS
ncbi:MAG TPA: radical SAM protein, partial [Vicinamibacterales bacterium]|nr:radical SAM protein [Vicinamibacterales bacterium]